MPFCIIYEANSYFTKHPKALVAALNNAITAVCQRLLKYLDLADHKCTKH